MYVCSFIFLCYRAFDAELLYIAQKLKIPISEVAVNVTEIEGNYVKHLWMECEVSAPEACHCVTLIQFIHHNIWRSTFIWPCIVNVLLKYNQQDVTLYSILYYCKCSTCFRRFFRPSSGAQNCTHTTRYMSSLLAATVTVNAVHLSGGFFAHHQKLKTVHTASGICQACNDR
jgi:hypothetical protein